MPPLRTAPVACAALCLGAVLPLSTSAQTGPPPEQFTVAPVVQELDVRAGAGGAPGAALDFTLRGTPHGRARVQVVGTGVEVPLREGAPGVYTGRHVLGPNERIGADAVLRSTLALGHTAVVSNFRMPPVLQPGQQTAVATPLPPQGPLQPLQPQQVLRIERFSAEPVDRLDPGTELRFAVDGPPGARASFELPNVASGLPMQEESPGHYVGRYTLRRQDVLGNGPVVATLRAGGQSVSAPLDTPLLTAAAAASTQMGAAPMTMLPLQITTPAAGTPVDPAGMLVQGRTAPGAMVHVQVDAVLPAAPGRLRVAEPLAQETVQAAADGQFSFSLGPQRVPPGTRLEVGVSASQGAQTTPEQRLVLQTRS